MFVGVNTLGMKPLLGGGEELYLRRILAQIGQLHISTQFVVFTDPGNHDSFHEYDRVCIEGSNDVASEASRAAVDLLFTSLDRAPSKIAVPLVLSVMDLWRVKREGNRRSLLRGSQLKKTTELCLNASALVVPSKFIRQELLDVLKIPLDRSVVAPLGVDDVFGQPQFCLVDKPYLLVVGNTREAKNIPRLMEAFGRISKQFPHNLVIAGQPFEAELEDWGPRVVRIDHLPAAHLAGLYQHCDLFVCPSLYEGSGVTVLEAMKAGASVATGRVGGIPEMVGNPPIFFNPESVDSMVGAIRRGLTEEAGARERRAHFGKQIAGEFTWEKCAWRTLSAFRRVEPQG